MKPRPKATNRKAIRRFNRRMLKKMNANNHKRHWKDAGIGYLLNRLDDEVIELMEAIHEAVATLDDEDFNRRVSEAIDECADVANFAMMIADNLSNGVIGGSHDSEYLEGEG